MTRPVGLSPSRCCDAWRPVKCQNFHSQAAPKAGQYYDTCSNTAADILTSSLLQWGSGLIFAQRSCSGWLRGMHIAATPSLQDISTDMYSCKGRRSFLLSPPKIFSGDMQQTSENRVRFYAAPKAPHDTLLSHGPVKMTWEIRATLVKAMTSLAKGNRVP